MAPTENPHTAILPRPTGAGARKSPAVPNLREAALVLRDRIEALRVPNIYGAADGYDMRALSDHVVEMTDAFDAWIAAVGRIVKSHAPWPTDLTEFDQPFFKAIEGNALFEISEVADYLDASAP